MAIGENRDAMTVRVRGGGKERTKLNASYQDAREKGNRRELLPGARGGIKKVLEKAIRTG